MGNAVFELEKIENARTRQLTDGRAQDVAVGVELLTHDVNKHGVLAQPLLGCLVGSAVALHRYKHVF
jgi:hypothetical protein